MGWSGTFMIDPSDMESRFAIEDGMAYMNSIFTEPTDDALEKIEGVKTIMESLPMIEADFIDLYYFKRKKQTDIAFIFDCSQPTVCYRLQRATARIQFLLQLPNVQEEDLLRDMTLFLTDPLDIQIMHKMWLTTCQSEVAKQLGVSQGLVRHRFLRTIKRLRQFLSLDDLDKQLIKLQSRRKKPGLDVSRRIKELEDRRQSILKGVPKGLQGLSEDHKHYDVYVRLFDFIAANLNILREVQRPVWGSQVTLRLD